MIRKVPFALWALFVFAIGAGRSGSAQGVAKLSEQSAAVHGSSVGASISSAALRLGIARPTERSHGGPDGYDCDASLQKRLAIGAVTGAIVGTAMYFAFTAIVPRGTGNQGRYAVALILPATVLGALREAQYPSRLSCPHG